MVNNNQKPGKREFHIIYIMYINIADYMYSFAFVSVKHILANIGLLVNRLIVKITKQWNIKTVDIESVYVKYSINSSARTETFC